MKSLAWLGAVIAICLVGWVLFPPVYGGKDSAKKTACLSNLKQFAFAHILYAKDYDDHLPSRDMWMDAISPYGKSSRYLVCPTLMKESNPQIYGYCFNGKLSLATIPKQPESIPLVFDSINLARNASGSLASLPAPGRHIGNNNNIVYADAHAKSVPNPPTR